MLITGGTGSFGQAFVKRLLDTHWGAFERICIYSRDEHKQALMREEFNDDRLRFFIGDVRDKERLRRAMDGVGIVVHAAALKRIETCHYNPSELVKTNIIGSMNVIDCAHDASYTMPTGFMVPRPRKVVFLSSDKAYQPISAYGQSKALAESLFLAANNTGGEHGPKFSVTRYGNVAGSKGSVIPKWRELINQHASITITDPNCTRFWMTMDEAIDLVLDTIKTGQELNIPILPAYRLGDLAEAMCHDGIITTSLPAHEKLHEGMADGNTSDKARRMTVKELRKALELV